jgi:hypothetical protein
MRRPEPLQLKSPHIATLAMLVGAVCLLFSAWQAVAAKSSPSAFSSGAYHAL